MPTKEPLRRVKRLVSRLNLPWNAVKACLRRFALAAVLSQGFVLGEHAPFALGYIAASGSGLEGAAALLGGLTGCLLGMDASGALRYIAAAILIYAVEFAFFDRPLYKSRWFMAVCSAVIAGITGFVYLSGAGWSQVAILNFASELVMVGISCLFFQGVGEDAPPDRGSLLFLTAALVVCLARFSPLGGNAGAALAVLLASRAGAGAAAATGGAVGLAVGLTEGGTPLLGAVLAFAGALTGGPLVKQKRLGTVLLFAACGLLATAWVQGGMELAAALVLAAVLYSILPEQLLRRVDRYTCPPVHAPSAPVETAAPPSLTHTQFRLEEQATAFRTLYEHIHESVLRGEPPENSAVIFDRVAERVCARCSHNPVCWRRHHTATCQALTQALSAMLDRGNTVMEDFPGPFRSRCMRMEEFLRVSNEELYRYFNRQQYRARLKNNRLAVCRQYAQLAALLSAAANQVGEEPERDPSGSAAAERAVAQMGLEARCDLRLDRRGRRTLEVWGKRLAPLCCDQGGELLSQALGVRMEPADVYRVRQGQRLVFRQSPPLAATVAAAAKEKEAGQPNGDNGLWFKDEDGVLWVVLCDGMGSGAGAAKESKLLMTLLKDFLHAGVEPAAALTTLTGALSLRGEVNGGFTTVDLLQVDLFNGSAALYKLGGAPAYLRKGGSLIRLTGSALPAGLETDRESAPDVSRFRLAAGDLLLLVTDGVTDGEGDDWLRSMIVQYRGESPRELAQAVLASPGAGREDDRTVVAVRFSNRT
ncbi:MAG: SpoIIE family protein phosphatase [Clostridiales bacterium]|nr:SpoIIE family protein phosphatase [Clostridiales bacterium]